MSLTVILVNVPTLAFRVIYHILLAAYRYVVPKPERSVDGYSVLITGAGGGIGSHLAKEWSFRGANVALVDINMATLKETAKQVSKSSNVKVKTYQCDITNRERVAALAADVRRDFGDIDVLVNNAGVLWGKAIECITEADVRKTMDVNLLSQFWMLDEFLPAMRKRNSGIVINVASAAGKVGVPMCADYCASKFGVVGLGESLKEELRQSQCSGVRIITVCPIFVNTGMTQSINGGQTKIVSRFEKLLEADEVASRIVQGALRDETTIYIPRRLCLLEILGSVLPQGALDALRDFLELKFAPATVSALQSADDNKKEH